MKGTYVERDRKKEKKKIKVPDASGPKKGVAGGAAAMVAGVPTAMPVSEGLIWASIMYSQGALNRSAGREAKYLKMLIFHEFVGKLFNFLFYGLNMFT